MQHRITVAEDIIPEKLSVAVVLKIAVGAVVMVLVDERYIAEWLPD